MAWTALRTGHPGLIGAAGAGLLAIAAAAALLPLAQTLPPATALGSLLTLAGCIELLAAAGEHGRSGALTRMASGATIFAGLVFLAGRNEGLFTLSWAVIGWLFLHGLLLLAAGWLRRSVPDLLAVAALVDLALAAAILLNMPVAALVVSLFGPTPEIVASFTFVVAASVLVTGLGLIAKGLLVRSKMRINPRNAGRADGHDALPRRRETPILGRERDTQAPSWIDRRRRLDQPRALRKAG